MEGIIENGDENGRYDLYIECSVMRQLDGASGNVPSSYNVCVRGLDDFFFSDHNIDI